MKYILSSILALVILSIQAQSIEERVIVPYVLSALIDDIHLSSNAGQIATTTFQSENLIISQGLLQGRQQEETTLGFDSENISHELFAYPNPTENEVKINLTPSLLEKGYSIRIFDLKGNNLPTPYHKSGNQILIDVRNETQGLVIIQITSLDKKEYGIIRINKI